MRRKKIPKEHHTSMVRELIRDILLELHRRAQFKAYARVNLKEFVEKRQTKIKDKVVKVFYCPEFYMCKEPVAFEPHEIFRALFVFNHWRKFARSGRRLSVAAKTIKSKKDKMIVLESVQTWRTQLYLIQAETKLSLPFLASVVFKN